MEYNTEMDVRATVWEVRIRYIWLRI